MDQNFMMNLPPEYQAEMQKFLRQQQIAQAMQKQAMTLGSGPTQFSGGYAAKNSPLLPIIQALSGYMGRRQENEAQTGMADTLKKYEGATSEEMGRLTQAQDPGVISSFRASPNSRVRALAEAITKQRLDSAGKAADVLKERDTGGALEALRTGNIPGAGYAPPDLRQPEVKFIPDPNNPGKFLPQTTNYDVRGQGKISLGSQGSNISVDARQQTQELGAGLDVIQSQLKERQARAQAAKETLSANTSALEALNAGAKTGGVEGIKQAARMVAQGFGINLPETAPTAEVQMALGNAILAKARALAPVTGEDVKRLEQILGSVNTDPQALMKMLSVYNGIATKELQDFDRYVKSVPGTLENPRARDMFQGAGIGYEMRPPPGSTQQGLRAVQELQKRGGDVSQFAVGGEQIPADAQFDIRGAGLPTQAGSAPPKLDPNKIYTIDELKKLGVLR